MITDIVYEFELSESIQPDYKFASSIIEWLTSNLEGLTDDKDKKLFSKVNTGFNEDSLKSFGSKPVCDVYINNIVYTTDFSEHKPESVNSIIIYYLKGANNPTYLKACSLHDYVMQEFLVNESFKRLTDIVTDTYILNSEIQPHPIGKKWGVMCILELSHILY